MRFFARFVDITAIEIDDQLVGAIEQYDREYSKIANTQCNNAISNEQV